MIPSLHWVDGPWEAKLAIAARPRGGDWLADEMAGWRRAGVETVLSLLTLDEEEELDLGNEADAARAAGMTFLSFPIPDCQVPSSESTLSRVLENVDLELSSGKSVLVHCRQGIGRSGLVACCLLLMKGWDPERAVECVSSACGYPVPETAEQRSWIDHYATILANAR